MKISDIAQQTVGRLMLAGALTVGVVVPPVAWSFTDDSHRVLPESVVASHNNSGIDQLQWLQTVQPRAQAPHVDTTVHQSR